MSYPKTLEELKKLRDEVIEQIQNGQIPDKLGKSRLNNLRDRIRDLEDISNKNPGLDV